VEIADSWTHEVVTLAQCEELRRQLEAGLEKAEKPALPQLRVQAGDAGTPPAPPSATALGDFLEALCGLRRFQQDEALLDFLAPLEEHLVFPELPKAAVSEAPKAKVAEFKAKEEATAPGKEDRGGGQREGESETAMLRRTEKQDDALLEEGLQRMHVEPKKVKKKKKEKKASKKRHSPRAHDEVGL